MYSGSLVFGALLVGPVFSVFFTRLFVPPAVACSHPDYANVLDAPRVQMDAAKGGLSEKDKIPRTRAGLRARSKSRTRSKY